MRLVFVYLDAFMVGVMVGTLICAATVAAVTVLTHLCRWTCIWLEVAQYRFYIWRSNRRLQRDFPQMKAVWEPHSRLFRRTGLGNDVYDFKE